MIGKAGHFLKRIIWLVIIGTMVAFHNFYQKEFKVVEDVKQEIIEDKEE